MIHPEIKKILTRIGMRDQMCCPFCCKPEVFTDITIKQAYYTTQCTHGCDLYGDLKVPEDPEPHLYKLSFTMNRFHVKCNFINDLMLIYRYNGEHSISELVPITVPLNKHLFTTEQTMLRKLKLYMTFS